MRASERQGEMAAVFGEVMGSVLDEPHELIGAIAAWVGQTIGEPRLQRR